MIRINKLDQSNLQKSTYRYRLNTKIYNFPNNYPQKIPEAEIRVELK